MSDKKPETIESLEDLTGEIQKSPEGFKLKIRVSANSKKNSFEFLDDDPAGNIIKIKKWKCNCADCISTFYGLV